MEPRTVAAIDTTASAMWVSEQHVLIHRQNEGIVVLDRSLERVATVPLDSSTRCVTRAELHQGDVIVREDEWVSRWSVDGRVLARVWTRDRPPTRHRSHDVAHLRWGIVALRDGEHAARVVLWDLRDLGTVAEMKVRGSEWDDVIGLPLSRARCLLTLLNAPDVLGSLVVEWNGSAIVTTGEPRLPDQSSPCCELDDWLLVAETSAELTLRDVLTGDVRARANTDEPIASAAALSRRVAVATDLEENGLWHVDFSAIDRPICSRLDIAHSADERYLKQLIVLDERHVVTLWDRSGPLDRLRIDSIPAAPAI